MLMLASRPRAEDQGNQPTPPTRRAVWDKWVVYTTGSVAVTQRSRNFAARSCRLRKVGLQRQSSRGSGGTFLRKSSSALAELTPILGTGLSCRPRRS